MASTSFRGNNYGFQVGENSGLIKAEIHLPPERPETPPSPFSTVPFPCDPDFVSRDTIFNQVHEKSSLPGSRIALVGLGGVGKSQIAIEYSYRVRAESPATWIFWVHASNEARFKESFQKIADRLKLPGRNSNINIYELVEDWLQDENKGKWICILDNADDYQFLCSRSAAAPSKNFTNAPTKALLDYVPRSQNGSIIITSRSREVSLKMVNHKDIIKVNPMEKCEALELLQKTLDQPEESLDGQQLVEELEFMPLAIVQAASSIRERGHRYSVSQYLQEFRGSDREAIKLLKREPGYINRDSEAKDSILVTWQISLDYIRDTKPSAADLLSLMSMFDRHGIPDSLIQLQPRTNHTSDSDFDLSDEEISEADEETEFEDNIATLRNYSFISVSEDSTFFTMHRLVQLTMRAWLRSHKQIYQWREIFTSILYQKFPTGQYENWGECRTLFPHIRSAMSQCPESQSSRLEWATILYRGAWYASESGNIDDVREMASKSRKQRVKLLGAQDIEALESTAMLAEAYSDEGRWEEAEKLLVQVIETRKTKLGVNHPNTLASMASLASTYTNQGRWDDAEQIEVQVMETRKTKLGVDHFSTLASIANLASTYWNQGRWEEAEQLNVKVMEIRKTKLGVDHPSTLKSMASLASTYMSQGRWEEAEQLLVQAIEIRAKLGVDHPYTLTSMANLASTYTNQGRWDEAEQIELQVMETRKTKLGVNHPDTLTSMANVALTWKSLGHDAKTVNLLRVCIVKQQLTLGLNHPDALANFDILLEWEMGKLDMNG